jgi:hypothetical protein
MTSESQTRYGSRLLRQGKRRRFVSYQLNSFFWKADNAVESRNRTSAPAARKRNVMADAANFNAR